MTKTFFCINQIVYELSLVPKPDSDAATQEVLIVFSVEHVVDGRWQMSFLQKVEMLLSFLKAVAGVEGPVAVLHQVKFGTKEHQGNWCSWRSQQRNHRCSMGNRPSIVS